MYRFKYHCKKNLRGKVLWLGLVSLLISGCSGASMVTLAVDDLVSLANKPLSGMEFFAAEEALAAGNGYMVVSTGQEGCYDNQQQIPCPEQGSAFFGQDGNYQTVESAYVDNGDGTISDLNTGLMWAQTPIDKATYAEAVAGAKSFALAGYDDWRLPTIKELYSLIDFNGSSRAQIPYIDTDYFDFRFGDESKGERTIDSQYWSSTEYVGTVFNGQMAVFGVNFADGRIKGYPPSTPGREMTQFVRYVRGNPDYGINAFVGNGDGTITDQATGLVWMQADSGAALDWEGALSYCENLDAAGHDDWRLPDAKELQSIVDYSSIPAIDPVFGLTDSESWFWTGTTHLDGFAPDNAVYIAFGRAYGVQTDGSLFDVHGAGAQRSDPKSGDPVNYASGRGSQGQNDEVRIYNYARCVRGGTTSVVTGGEVPPVVQGGPEYTNPPQNGQPPGRGGNQPGQPPGGQPPGEGPGGQQNQPPRLDLASAAAQLGVSEEQLKSALGDPGQGPPDLASAAAKLGVSVETLTSALGIPGGPPPTP